MIQRKLRKLAMKRPPHTTYQETVKRWAQLGEELLRLAETTKYGNFVERAERVGELVCRESLALGACSQWPNPGVESDPPPWEVGTGPRLRPTQAQADEGAKPAARSP